MQPFFGTYWRDGTPLRSRTCRRYALLLIITILIIFLFRHNATRLETDVEEARPQYFLPSPFREHPDFEYEAKISAALQDIERKARSVPTFEDGAKETIWQVMLKDLASDRGSDSVSFEQENPGWAYQVSEFICFFSYWVCFKEHFMLIIVNIACHQGLGRFLSYNDLLHCAGPLDSIRLIPQLRSPWGLPPLHPALVPRRLLRRYGRLSGSIHQILSVARSTIFFSLAEQKRLL